MSKLRLVPSKCIVDMEGCAANVTSALTRGLPVCGHSPRRRGALAIVGSAPSVRDHLDELKAWPGEIWAINGAYEFLKSEGIVPHGFVGLDPVPGLAEYVKGHTPETTFFISSVCDPAVFDALKGAHVWLWHSKMADIPYPPHHRIVGGGTTCMTRAPILANLLGWRDVTIYGADSSYSQGSFYAYQHGTFGEDTKHERVSVVLDGTVFESEWPMIKQVSQLGAMHGVFAGQLKFKCGGLMDAFLKSPVRDVTDFGTFEPDEAA